MKNLLGRGVVDGGYGAIGSVNGQRPLTELAQGGVTVKLMRPCAGSSIIYDFNLRVKRFIKRQRVS